METQYPAQHLQEPGYLIDSAKSHKRQRPTLFINQDKIWQDLRKYVAIAKNEIYWCYPGFYNLYCIVLYVCKLVFQGTFTNSITKVSKLNHEKR